MDFTVFDYITTLLEEHNFEYANYPQESSNPPWIQVCSNPDLDCDQGWWINPRYPEVDGRTVLHIIAPKGKFWCHLDLSHPAFEEALILLLKKPWDGDLTIEEYSEQVQRVATRRKSD